MRNLKTLSLEILEKLHEAASEALCDIETQYYAEINTYGDAWPGSKAQVDALRKDVSEIEDELQTR